MYEYLELEMSEKARKILLFHVLCSPNFNFASYNYSISIRPETACFPEAYTFDNYNHAVIIII